jgi:ABC-type transport system involved in multi-copper enzyme maturation permease subunit
MTTSYLSGLEATTAIARLSVRRVLRGKAIWFAVALGLLPTLLAIAQRVNGADLTQAWNASLTSYTAILAIVAPILVAASLSDEIDDRTSAYLWSRALPRWSVVTGKLLGLAPIAAAVVAVGLTATWLIQGQGSVGLLARGLAGFTAGALGACAISAMVATLFPRFAVPIAVSWLLLLDGAIGAIDAGVHVIAVSFGARAIADGDGGLAAPLSLVTLTAIAIAVAIWRVDRIE